jgi:hypothetical protein
MTAPVAAPGRKLLRKNESFQNEFYQQQRAPALSFATKDKRLFKNSRKTKALLFHCKACFSFTPQNKGITSNYS